VNHLLIENCKFLHDWGASGLKLVDGSVHFKGNVTFYNNTARYGGGILMTGSESALYLSPHTTLNFTKNSALITGGAIHIETIVEYDPTSTFCCIQLVWTNRSILSMKSNMEQQGIQIVFQNNSAEVAGTAIWGGALDRPCIMSYRSTYLSDLFEIVNNESSPSAISSSPQDLCYCNGTKICTVSPWENKMYGPSFTLYPGQSLEVEIAIAGQLNGLVPGLVQAQLKDAMHTSAHLGHLQRTQRVNQAKCAVLRYTIYSSKADSEVQLKLLLAKTTEHESELLNYQHNYLCI